MPPPRSKDLIPIGSALDDLSAMPDEVKGPFGAALRFEQNGGWPADVRPFGEGLPREVMKLAESFDGDTYRAAFVADFPECVYRLHCFMKNVGFIAIYLQQVSRTILSTSGCRPRPR